MCNPKAEDNKQADAVNNNPRRRAMTKSSKQQKERSGGVQKGVVERTESVVTGNARRLKGEGSLRWKIGGDVNKVPGTDQKSGTWLAD